MNYFRMILFSAAVLIFASGVQAQTTVIASKGDTPTTVQTQEQTNSLDSILEDLRKQNEPVVRGCFDPCSDSEILQGQVKVSQPVERVMPEYPAIARTAHATGSVVVVVVIDETGKVIAVKAASGHPLLQAAAVKAAKDSAFMPTSVAGNPVKVLATITYNFVMM